MLVLSRNVDGVIWIGDNIKITVVSIDRGKVRIGITAPRDMPVLREELLERKLLVERLNQQEIPSVNNAGPVLPHEETK